MFTNPMSSRSMEEDNNAGKEGGASSGKVLLKKKTSLFQMKQKMRVAMQRFKSSSSDPKPPSPPLNPEDGTRFRFTDAVEMIQLEHKVGKHRAGKASPSKFKPKRTERTDSTDSIRGTVLGSKIQDGLQMLEEKRAAHSATTESRSAIPLHDALVALNIIHRNGIVNDFLRFFVMFFFFYLYVQSSHSPHVAHDQTTVVTDLFLAEEFPDIEIYKNFFSVAQQEEVWGYFDGVLRPGLFPEFEWYSDRDIPSDGRAYGFAAQQLKVVGSVLVRQVRVEPVECDNNFGRKCYPAVKDDNAKLSKTFTLLGSDGFDLLIPGGIELKTGSSVVKTWLPLEGKDGTRCNLWDPRNKATGLKRRVDMKPGDTIVIWYKDGSENKKTNVTFAGFFNETEVEDEGGSCGFKIEEEWLGPSTPGYRSVAYRRGGFNYTKREYPLEGLFGWDKDYPTESFEIQLDGDLNPEAAKLIFDKLREGTWTDKQTRIVAFDMNLYNANTKYVTVLRLQIQFLPSGKIIPSHFVMSFAVGQPEVTKYVFIALYAIAYLFKVSFELKRMYDYRFVLRSFLTRAHNLIQFLFIGLNGMAVLFWTKVLSDVDVDSFDDQTLMKHEYIDLQRSARLLKRALIMGGGVIVVSCMNFFRLASLNHGGKIMYRTMVRVFNDLSIYIMLLGVFLTSFAVAGMWIFGTEMRPFHNFKSSISTVTRFSLGDFDYEELSLTYPKATGYFFFAFQLVIFVFCLNIIVAVLVDAYDKTSRAADRDASWERLMPSLTYSFGRDILNNIRKYFFFLPFMKPVSKHWRLNGCSCARSRERSGKRCSPTHPQTCTITSWAYGGLRSCLRRKPRLGKSSLTISTDMSLCSSSAMKLLCTISFARSTASRP